MVTSLCTSDFHGYENKGIHPIGIQRLLTVSPVTNNKNYYVLKKSLLVYGVIGIKIHKNSPPQKLQDVLQILKNNYPHVDGFSRFGVVIAQTRKYSFHEQMTIRGLHLVGDVQDLALLWSHLSSGVTKIQNFNIDLCCLCWGGYSVTPDRVLAYLDFDEYVPLLSGKDEDDGSSFLTVENVIENRIVPAINLVSRELKQTEIETKIQLFFGERLEKGKNGLKKVSFHVHFFNVVVDVKDFKMMLKGLDTVKKRIWRQTSNGGWVYTDDPKNNIFDTTVYGGEKQLFRGPFCGKSGEVAPLLPVELHQVNDKWVVKSDIMEAKSSEELDTVKQEMIFRARITSPIIQEAGMFFADLSKFRETNNDSISRTDNSTFEPLISIKSDHLYKMTRGMIYQDVLPKWLQMRKKQASETGGLGYVPFTLDKNSVDDIPNPRTSYVRFITVPTDTYCSTDNSHFHSKQFKTPIRYHIDLHQCTIRQYCFACGTGGPLFHWLHTDGVITPMTEKQSDLTKEKFFLQLKDHRAVTFFAGFFRDFLLYNTVQDSVYVFNEEMKVWTSGPTANIVINRLIDKLNKLAQDHSVCQQEIVNRRLLEQLDVPRHSPEYKEEEKKLIKKSRKFLKKNTPFLSFSMAFRQKLMTDLRSIDLIFSVKEMNTFPHLIPMKNQHAFNVFTGDVVPCQKEHLFTSLLDVNLTDCEHDISVINEWFKQVTTGDQEKLVYVQQICAYMFTHLMHDRMFFVFKGSGKNGKSLLKELLLKSTTGAYSTDTRYKNLNQQYWEKRANSNVSSESASPESFQLIDKSILSTDDIEQTIIDAGKLKRLVAGEQISGRPLYGVPRPIFPRGKILWTSNHWPLLNGNDNALWERFSPIEFLGKWVQDPDMVNEKEFVFLQDNIKYTQILKMTDAFFTICVKELSTYYQTLESDQNDSPICLTPFPLPGYVKKLKSSIRAEQLPLASFVLSYTKETQNPLEFTPVAELFKDYLVFLENNNEGYLRKSTTRNLFERQLVTSLEVKVVKIQNESFAKLMMKERPAKKLCLDYDRVTADSTSVR